MRIYPAGAVARKPVGVASVSLYHTDKRRESGPEMHAYQGPHGPHDREWKPFEFDHLTEGDYIMVFNAADFAEPETPFHRTYFPQAAKLQGAQVIHVLAGQEITNADIHLGSPAAVREITVNSHGAAEGRTRGCP